MKNIRKKLKVESSSKDIINEILYKIETILKDKNIPNEIKVRTKTYMEYIKNE